jgi:hypothetical protein
MEGMPRKLQALGEGAPSVESSLDDFISRANDEIVDVAKFDPDSAVDRELALQQEVDELKQRLASAPAPVARSRGWGKLVIGYVLGCASIFAVTTLMPKSSPPAQPATAVTAPATVQPTPTAPPTPAAQPTPTAPAVQPTPSAPAVQPTAPVAVQPTPTAPAEAVTPIEPAPVAAPQPAVAPPPIAQPPAPKVTKKPRRAVKPATEQPSTPQEPATDTGSANGLYDPF